MTGIPLARQIMARVIPGGLEKWFEDHADISARKLPAAFAATELIDGEPFGELVNPRTLRAWKAALTTKEQQC